MLLAQTAHFNNLSDKLRTELEEKVRGFGKSVRYRFDIAKPNPDPSRYNGDTIYPNVYTLDPTRFTINDPYEDRKGISKSKLIALVADIDEKGLPNRFKKVRVEGKFKAILKLETQENEEHFNIAMFLELHPKLSNGQFADKNTFQVVSRIDESAAAQTAMKERSQKRLALNAIEDMGYEKLKNFADAMQWDSTEPEEILRNMAEELAEEDPKYFNDLVASKNVEYQSLVTQAKTKDFISYDPAENKFVWKGNGQTIAMLPENGEGNDVIKLSKWLQDGGSKAEETYKKLKSLVSGKEIKATA